MAKRRKLLVWGGALAVSAALVLLIVTGHYQCPIYATFGVPCAGCGMTRAGWALLRLDFGAAFTLNPSIYLLLAAGVVAGISALRGKKGRRLYRDIYFYMAVCMAIIIVWLVRMFTMFPDQYPMVVNQHSLLVRLLRG